MAKIVLVSGGARSGKSEFAESLIAKEENLYIATSIPFDDEMKNRVNIHKQRRGSNWSTVEIYKDFEKIVKEDSFKRSKNIFLDCLTLMITNMMMDIVDGEIEYEDEEKIENKVNKELKKLICLSKRYDKNLIMVTNEIGFGIVPENKMSRIFRDIAGRINRNMAKISDEVFIVFMGIPNKLK
ncbi:MAG: bifunctional adenosylcobinamide kinase/adenosylcobinamide-phosphate guanylyltransferase [Andreesenia angusta]|nr:bifunctional adenosylcobinamide kinase/adenosylcobinamide-phosphate guanylyltransferase [Andreesenia angusta]